MISQLFKTIFRPFDCYIKGTQTHIKKICFSTNQQVFQYELYSVSCVTYLFSFTEAILKAYSTYTFLQTDNNKTIKSRILSASE